MAENNNYLNDSRRKNWFWDFNDIFNSSLSSNAILVRLYLARCADNTTRQAFPSLKNIAEHCKLSRATVKRAINELIEKGWLIKEVRRDEEGDYDSNLYTLCDPPEELKQELRPKGEPADPSADEGGGLTVNLPCNKMTPPPDKQNRGGWAHSEPTVGSQRTEGWAPCEPTVGSQGATNNTNINNTHLNNTQQQSPVVVDNNSGENLCFSAGPSSEEVDRLRNFAEKKGIKMNERFAAAYITTAGSIEAAKELVDSCASYIVMEKRNGHKIRSVTAILVNAVKNFLTGATVNENIASNVWGLNVWGLSSKEDKYRDLYLNRLEE